MIVRQVNICAFKRCQLEPLYEVSTNDHKTVYWVCPQHRSWAESMVYMEEHPA